MKKILSLILALTLVLGMVFTLASCGKMLSGTYTNSTLQTSYEFAGNTVKKTSPSLSSLLGGSEKLVKEGTYKITEAEDGTFTITFTWAEDDVVTESFTEIEVNGEKSIQIGLVTYTKEQ